MAQKFSELSEKHINFIQQQPMFFVATAGSEGLVNLSPKGMDSFRVIDPRNIIWMNLTGSGNESAAHVLENPRMTIMFCSFDQQPLILRLYGKAELIYPKNKQWANCVDLFPEHISTRQFFKLNVELVLTSCGFGVPYFSFKGQRPNLEQSEIKRGSDGLKDYWKTKNSISLDGKDTGIL